MPVEVAQILGLYWIMLGATALWLRFKDRGISEKLEQIEGPGE